MKIFLRKAVIRTPFFLVLFLLGFFIVLQPALAEPPSEFEQKKAELSDTDFVYWLQDWTAPNDEQLIRQFEILSSSKLVPDQEQFEYFIEWTNLVRKIPKPRNQIGLALRLQEFETAQEWIDIWLEQARHNSRDYNYFIDLFVDRGDFETGERIIRKARERLNNNTVFFQRLAAIYEAEGKYQKALDEFLRVLPRYSFQTYFRARMLHFISEGKLEEYFIEDVQEGLKNGNLPGALRDIAVDLLAKGEAEADLLVFLENISSNTGTYSKYLREYGEQLTNDGFIAQGLVLSERLMDLTGEPGDRLDYARKLINAEKTEQALQVIKAANTDHFTEDNWTERELLFFRIDIFNRELEGILQQLAWIENGEEIRELKIETLKAKNEYGRLQEYLTKIGDTGPEKIFMINFMRGEVDRVLLEQLVEDFSDRHMTVFALALAGADDPDQVRACLAWLDRNPFEQTLVRFPTILGDDINLPKVVLDRWHVRFDPFEQDAEELLEWGQKMEYPPLMIDAARAFERAGRTGQAIRILEEILLNFPETMHRNETEQLLHQFS